VHKIVYRNQERQRMSQCESLVWFRNREHREEARSR